MRIRLILIAALSLVVISAITWVTLDPRDGGSDAPVSPEATVENRKILMIGLDAADWDIIDPMMARGELPNLARLADEGVRARLRTVVPILSPVVWTSVATGKRPEKHGILDFLARAEDGSMVPVTSTLWQGRPVWSMLGESGIPVAVTAWWATWPAGEVNGYMATDRIAYQLFRHLLEEQPDGPGGSEGRGKTWPPELFDEISPLIVRPQSIGDEDLAVYVDLERLGAPDADDEERLEDLRTAIASARTYEAIGQMLLSRQPRGFHSVYNESTDTIAHLFMPFHPPAMRGTDPGLAEAFAGVITGAYREADAMVGRLIESAGEGWTIVVLSDHGFKHGDNRPSTDSRVTRGAGADWHDRFGILILRGPDIRSGEVIADATILDIAPTILALYGLPVGEDMDGRVLEEALAPEFLARHGVSTVPTWERGRSSSTPAAPSDQDAGLMEKLKALGYIAGDSAPGEEGHDDFSLDGARSFNNRGIALMAAGKMDEALTEFEKGLYAGGGSQSLLNIANVHLAREDAGEAEKVIRRIELEYPGFRNLASLEARLADLRGDAGAAEKFLMRAIAIDPADSRSLTRLAHLREEEGERGEALDLYRRAVRANPENAEAFNYIGNILRETGDEAGAEVAYRHSVEVDPKYAGGYNNLGLILQSSGRTEEAVELYRKGLHEAPDSALLHNSLGSLLIVGKDLESAESHIRKALELDPSMAEAHNNLGIVMASRGLKGEARERFEEAARLAPDMADAHFNLARILLLHGEFENGLVHFMTAADLDPRHLDAALGAGETAFRLGRDSEALRYFEQAESISPGIERVRRRLRELRER